MPATPTLSAIIAEMEREIRMRKEVYPRQRMRASEAEYKIGLMEEGRKILIWLESIGRDELKEFLAQRKAKQDDVQGGEAGGAQGCERESA